jgi:predicted DCC family thiol-disulfide oxidoreductase YuxK
MIPGKEKIIVFDGKCNLCNKWVQFVIKYDRDKKLKFCALQSKTGQKISAQFLKDVTELKTVIFIDGTSLYIKSTAALYILKHLSGIWSFFFILVSIPRPIRDFIYDFIAKNRYKWFGKSEHCMVPKKEVLDRFIDRQVK